MADICGNLWDYNLARVVVVDVSDDYRLARPPLPNDCYPVLTELRLPTYQLSSCVTRKNLVDGYLYDWHQAPDLPDGVWYVGVVYSGLLQTGLDAELSEPSPDAEVGRRAADRV